MATAQMDEKMKQFLTEIAATNGRAGDLRWAAEEVIRRAMAQTENAKFPRPEEQDKTSSTPVPAEEPPTTATPKAEAAPATPKAPKAPKAPKVAAETPDLDGVRPTAVRIEGDSIEAKSWRQALIALTERAIAAGKFDDVPPNWIKDAEHRTVSPLSNGKFLYTNLTGGQSFPRMRKLATILGTSTTILTVDNAGTAQEVPLA